MSKLNMKSAPPASCKPFWLRTFIVLGSVGATGILALAFFPDARQHAGDVVAHSISSAIASDYDTFVSPAEARKQRLSEAKTAVHGMYVKDAYGCIYMFQYLSARLSVTPVLDERQQPVCIK